MRALLLISLLGLPLTSLVACGDDDSSDTGSGGRSGTGGRAVAQGGDNGGGESAGSGATSDSGGSAGAIEGGAGNTGGNSTTGGASAGATSSGGSATGGAGANDSGGAGAAGGSDGGSGNEAGAGGTGPLVITLTVDTSQSRRPISPLIYGVNPNATACSNAVAHFSLCRLGGNRWSTYNWENNASNAGNVLCYQNDDALGASSTPAAPATALLAEASADTSVLLTIPILDHVAADKTGGTAPPACSGDVRNSANFLTTRFLTNRASKGSLLSTTPDTSDAFVNQDEFVSFVRSQAGTKNVLFALDNQPSLWDVTHLPVHPADPTFAEVVARNVEYATMVRGTWPTAEIAGYVGYGWNDFTTLEEAPDRTGQGEFVDYYLAKMREASTTATTRLIDYLDIHWYPELYSNNERIIGGGTSPEMVELRVHAPLSLWASGYREDSWITRDYLNGPIELIPRLKAKIAANYADTKLAISEWSYGGDAHISGALATADALGVFGREGLDLAAFQPATGDVSFALGAFALFRNYDGAGTGFGDTSVSASSSDVQNVSVYASVDAAAPKRVVIIAINRSADAQRATLNVTDSTEFTQAKLYALTSAAATPQAMGTQALANNQLDVELPAFSVLVIAPEE